MVGKGVGGESALAMAVGDGFPDSPVCVDSGMGFVDGPLAQCGRMALCCCCGRSGFDRMPGADLQWQGNGCELGVGGVAGGLDWNGFAGALEIPKHHTTKVGWLVGDHLAVGLGGPVDSSAADVGVGSVGCLQSFRVFDERSGARAGS